MINGTCWQETRQVTTWIGLDGIPWSKSEITRQIEDVMYKVVDIFEQGKNIIHKESSSLPDEKKLEQFKKIWAQKWSNQYNK